MPDYYYDPAYVFDAHGVYSNHKRAEYSTHPTYTERQKILDEMTKSIVKDGIKNPVLVTIIPQHPPQAPTTRLHPGQSRCRALRRLGLTTVPALIRDKAGTYKGAGKPITLSEAKALFSGDTKLDNRGVCIMARNSPWRTK